MFKKLINLFKKEKKEKILIPVYDIIKVIDEVNSGITTYVDNKPINKSEEIEHTTEKLKYHKLKAEAIYGSSSKEERKNAMDMFISGKAQILVSSDLSARCLNIDDVDYIFNLDLPPTSKEYIHRVGRTARGSKSGTAVSIITAKDRPMIRSYERELNIKIDEKDLSHGQIVDKENK